MEPVRKRLDEIHWHYASEILKAAHGVARSEGAYPVLVTEGMAKAIEKRTGVPVVSITYDGTSGSKNEAVVPYLAHLNRERD